MRLSVETEVPRAPPNCPPPAGAERDAPSPVLGLPWPTRASCTKRHRGWAAPALGMVVQLQVGAETLHHSAGRPEAHLVRHPRPGVRYCVEAGNAKRSCWGWVVGLPAARPVVVAEAQGPGSLSPGWLEPSTASFLQTQHLQSCSLCL